MIGNWKYLSLFLRIARMIETSENYNKEITTIGITKNVQYLQKSAELRSRVSWEKETAIINDPRHIWPQQRSGQPSSGDED